MIITETRPLEFADEALGIPEIALDLSGFSGEETHQLHIHQDVLILMKQDMGAAEIVRAIEGLHQTSAGLVVRLARACGPCERCEKTCPADTERIPEEVAELFSACGLCLGALKQLLDTGEVIG
jgi:hypothetical protein